MDVNSSAGYAASVNMLNSRSQFQTGQVRASSEQSQQVTELLSGGQNTAPAASGGRGQIVDIKV